MLATFTLTQTIAIFLGLYMLSAGIGLLTDLKGYASVMDDFLEFIGLTYIAAVAAFFAGATLVAIHNIWSTPLEIIVSLVGWAALIEGVLMLAFRRPFFTIVGAMPLNEKFMKGYGVFTITVAAILFYLALT